ncbi:uncharacterized protein RCC_00759 [Ramularia collo-cygni]|uniref:Uncharacterized protein n=1 Tax=Ramularia collo-cygni TaxID=112498 RepID=A0A2D3UR37_9PEZI|nr:uncharacterized protein RCC_00759 [Ramularia collo-cygni]CZT14810.1 uncharacterized protein RCC_00759 [Ramularia collo-cygni]
MFHYFHPSQPKQEKLSMECSLPQPISSIKRITTALPYPSDISEALNYSAAYVDHAAHLAKHALSQFEQLQKAHSDLHTTAENRSKQIKDLQCHVRDHEEEIRGLNSKYTELEKQRARDVTEAKKREDLLRKQLKEAQAALTAAEAYIAKDKVDDIKRDGDYKKHIEADHKHISADHLKIKQAEERAVKAEARCIQLQDLLDAANQELVVTKASLNATREQLTASQATVAKLTADLAAETKLKVQLQIDLKTTNGNLEKANEKIVELRKTIEAKDETIVKKEATIVKREEKIAAKGVEVDRVRAQLDAMDIEVNKVRADLKEKIKETQENEKEFAAKVKEVERVRAQLDAMDTEVNSVRVDLKAKIKELKDNEVEYKDTLASQRNEHAETKKEILRLKAHHKSEHEDPLKKKATANVVEVVDVL